jgi:hypothetical protein
MLASELVLVAIVDLLAVLATAGYTARILRRSSVLSAPASRASAWLAAAAAVLLLAALPLPWARATPNVDGVPTLTGMPASSMAGAAIAVSALALSMAAALGLRGGRGVVAVTGVVLGTGWSLIALNSLLLTAAVNRAIGGGHVAVGPAVWVCLVGGPVAVAAGAMATRDLARVAGAAPTVPQAPANVDEWGIPRPVASHEAGDQW